MNFGDKEKGIAAIVLSIIIMIFIFMNRDYLISYDWESLGYIGIFLVMLLTSATVILPVPGLAIATVFGAFSNPLLVGVFGGVGSALGELVGYMVGYGGGRVIDSNMTNKYEEIRGMIVKKNRGFILILLLSLVPNPLFDIAGMAAGAVKYPVSRFFIACAIGKIIKVIIFAYAGHYFF
ncbi:MAG: VTT domain-containing protein [Candidatus Kryptoniota bacterium]